MTQHHIRVTDDGRHQVYVTTNGIDRVDVGPSWKTPREAIDYSDTLSDHVAANRALGNGPEGIRAEITAKPGVPEAPGPSEGHPASRSAAHSDLAGSGELRSRDEDQPSSEAPTASAPAIPPGAGVRTAARPQAARRLGTSTAIAGGSAT